MPSTDLERIFLSVHALNQRAKSHRVTELVIKGLVRCEVSMAVTMKNAVFWDVTLCGSCMN
jgi:hypothetical protein